MDIDTFSVILLYFFLHLLYQPFFLSCRITAEIGPLYLIVSYLFTLKEKGTFTDLAHLALQWIVCNVK